MAKNTSLQENNKYPDSVSRYIKKLYRFDKTGKILLSITISIIISLISFFILKKPGALIAFKENAQVSIFNLVILLLLYFFSFLVCSWLFIWKTKRLEMNVFTATITIQKDGNTYVSSYGRLFVPYPWLRLIKDGATFFCLLGKWNRFSLTHNGVYLLGISELGFDIEKHENKGFFKYKGMPVFLFLSFLFIITGFVYFVFTVNMQYFTNEIGKLALIIEKTSLATSAASCFFILFFLIRNITIKRRIKQTIINN